MNLLKILPTVPFMDTARGYGLQMSRDYSKKKKKTSIPEDRRSRVSSGKRMAAKGSFRKSYRAGMKNSSTMGMSAGGGLYDRAHLENNGWVDILMGLNM